LGRRRMNRVRPLAASTTMTTTMPSTSWIDDDSMTTKRVLLQVGSVGIGTTTTTTTTTS
jgi:hypothetical protein